MVDHQVGAQGQRALQRGRAKGVVHRQQRAGIVRQAEMLALVAQNNLQDHPTRVVAEVSAVSTDLRTDTVALVMPDGLVAAGQQLVWNGKPAEVVVPGFSRERFERVSHGRLLDVQIGFGIAQVFDPVTRRQVPVLASLFDQLAIVVFFLANGHHVLLRGLASRMEPALKDMGAAMAEMEPKLREVLALIDDLRNYHAPERLENGDILIRRKTPAELKLEGLEGPATDL